MMSLQEVCSRLDRGEISSAQFLERFTRWVAAEIGCSRAGVWIFADTLEGRALRCAAMFDAPLDRMRMDGTTDMVPTQAAAYFEALKRDSCVVANNARTHPATIGFLDDYLLPLNVHSLMDVCFSVNGVMFGTFSCEQVGHAVVWTPRQLTLLRQIGARASLALMRAARSSIDTETFNASA